MLNPPQSGKMAPLLWNIVALSAVLISAVGSVKVVTNLWSGRRIRAGPCSHRWRSVSGWQQSITLGQLHRTGLRVIISLECRYSLAFSSFSPRVFSRHIYNQLLELLLIKQYRKGLSDYLLAATHLLGYNNFVLTQVEMNCGITTVSLNMLNSLLVTFGNYPILISELDLSKNVNF